MPDYQENAWPQGSHRYGAKMGRMRNVTQGDDFDCKRLTLRRVALDSGGYDSTGAYFGIGSPLYWCANDDGTIDMTFRASSRAAAKAHVRENYPAATFLR